MNDRSWRLWLATAVAGTLTVAIHFGVFPVLVQQSLRDWLMHGTAVCASCLAVGLFVGVPRPQRPAEFRWRLRLSCWLPMGMLALHELGQWSFPDGPRDGFDSCRDLALNGAGTVAAWWLLAREAAILRPPRPRSAAVADFGRKPVA